MINTENKGICIDDTLAATTPGSNFFSWPCVGGSATFVRTYHYTTGGTPAQNWVTYCVNNGIPIMVGLSLNADNGQAELNAFSADYINAPSKYDNNVIAIAVGNESLDVTSITTALGSAKSMQTQGKLPKNAKITTVLSTDVSWFAAPTYPPQGSAFSGNAISVLADSNLDVVAFNCYAGYQNQDTSWAATATTLNQFGAIRFAMQAASINKPFWCTEIGWSGGVGDVNMRTFYNGFSQFPTNTSYTPAQATTSVMPPDRIFYFSARDADGESYGLYTTSGGAKITTC